MKMTLADLVPTGGQDKQSGDDWLSRANTLVTNFKGLLEAARASQAKAAETSSPEQGQPGELATLMQLLIKYGLGDTPVGQLIKKVEPYTLKQIVGVLENAARPKK